MLLLCNKGEKVKTQALRPLIVIWIKYSSLIKSIIKSDTFIGSSRSIEKEVGKLGRVGRWSELNNTPGRGRRMKIDVVLTVRTLSAGFTDVLYSYLIN